ncbi:MAG: ABC transporter substrate-binding protein [Caldimonas sp.]
MKRGRPEAGFRADRRRVNEAIAVAALNVALPASAQSSGGAPAAGKKVLRYAFRVAETSLDPVKINDIYSRTLTPHIFEALYKYDPLARPIKIVPLTADGMPQVSEDFRTWTIRIRPGIFFMDDPAFKGKRRELVAQDYVYTLKRFADPANRSPVWSGMETDGYLGLAALRKDGLARKQPFDYDREIEGVRALDRYTFQVRLEEPKPRFVENFAGSDLFGAVAREVVEFYGDQVDAHPVGTGPFRLVQWRRSSRLVFERNPDFREMFFDAQPAPDDVEGQALVARFKGRRLPMVDRVEISIVEEEQPRWLAFLNGEADFIERVAFDFIEKAMPNGKVAPNLARQHIRGYQQVEPAETFTFFNMESPMVGGYTPADIALRRAIGLGMDSGREARQLRKGQAIVAQTPIIPYTTGFDLVTHSEYGEYDPARAKGLLDTYGYVDRNADGYRERPDGSLLMLDVATQSDQAQRQLDELFKKNMDAIGIRTTFKVAQWPENLKAARAGKLMLWPVGTSAAGLDGLGALARYDSTQIGGQNMARFKMPAMDAIYRKLDTIPDGPERDALFKAAISLSIAYMPYKFRLNRIVTDMAYPQLIGYRRPVFWQEWWHYVDIEPGASMSRPARS